MIRRILFLLTLSAAPLSFGQGWNTNVGGLPIRSGATVPAACTPNGTLFFKTATTRGWYFCQSGTFVAFGTGSPSVSLDQVTSAGGAVIWNNGANAITVNNTSSVTQTFANTSAATSSVAQLSPLISLGGQYWNGAASAADTWTVQNVIANGTNGQSQLVFSHAGTAGSNNSVLFKGPNANYPMQVSASSGNQDTGFIVGNSSAAWAIGFRTNQTGGGWFEMVIPGGAIQRRWVSGDDLLGSGGVMGWDSTANFSGSGVTNRDASLSRASVGVVQVGTTGANFSGTLLDTTTIEKSANAAQWVHGQISELITLSTSGTTTDSAANLLPADSIIESVVARVTTTITTATDWKLGDATIAGRFSPANSTMTSGSTQVGTIQADQTGSSGPRQVAAAKLRITTTGTPGAGIIRVTVYYRQFIAPTS